MLLEELRVSKLKECMLHNKESKMHNDSSTKGIQFCILPSLSSPRSLVRAQCHIIL